MYEFLLTLLGAIIGFLGAVCGAIISENRQRKRELREFYSWVASLLHRLFEKNQPEKVKGSLTAPTLHYSFNKLWSRVPQKDGDLEIRELIFRFLKGGSELDKIMADERFKNLGQWLEKHSK